MAETLPPDLVSLARAHGIQTSYYDVHGERRTASFDGLIALLRCFGDSIATAEDARAILRARKQQRWREVLEPVLVAWDGRVPEVPLRLSSAQSQEAVRFRLRLEHGEVIEDSLPAGATRPEAQAHVEGTRYIIARCPLASVLPASRLPDGRLPCGYHDLSIEVGSQTWHALVVSAPRRAVGPRNDRAKAAWGIFLPLYALHSERSWGAGDLGDLRALMDWAVGLGGSVVATLPLLPTFLSPEEEISPYSPVSRLFWNDFYLDLSGIPELKGCAKAKALLQSQPYADEIASLRRSSFVDYRRQMSLKRRVIEELVQSLLSAPSQRRDAFREFVAAHPVVEDYASFRAACEYSQSPWPGWPDRQRGGQLDAGDFTERDKNYHLYAQWVARGQLRSLAEHMNGKGEELYLDLPLGVHTHGYDVWREREAFILEASGGAPPDSVFTNGQNWGFAPLSPDGIRRQGYRHVIAYLRHHMEVARVLRIDHVMGLHRLYMVPRGFEATQGAYVQYRPDELYAVLSAESHRHGTWLVGENLGTVPAHVNRELARHRVQSMYVVQYELKADAERPLRPIPRMSVASLNTHDMRPFAGYWQALDIEDRREMGLMEKDACDEEKLARERVRRALEAFLYRKGLLESQTPELEELLRASLSFIAGSGAALELINLEDLWLETEPQNVPDSNGGRPNWLRKARLSLEEIRASQKIADIICAVDASRPARRPKVGRSDTWSG